MVLCWKCYINPALAILWVIHPWISPTLINLSFFKIMCICILLSSCSREPRKIEGKTIVLSYTFLSVLQYLLWYVKCPYICGAVPGILFWLLGLFLIYNIIQHYHSFIIYVYIELNQSFNWFIQCSSFTLVTLVLCSIHWFLKLSYHILSSKVLCHDIYLFSLPSTY